MTNQSPSSETQHRSSPGHTFAASGWLDIHFAAFRPEYEAMARAAGFQPGWHVLDAGCGGGDYLPILADLVGPAGRVTALDLAPENTAAVRARLADWHLPAPLAADVGSVLVLPYADATFDGLWCAAVTQYLTDDELGVALAEFRRVVRPGGLVAIKELDGSLMRAPAPLPGLIQHLREARAAAGSTQARGALRGPELRGQLRRAGLEHVRARTMLAERRAPYSPAERQYVATLLETFARMADDPNLPLPPAERGAWRELRARGGHPRRPGSLLPRRASPDRRKGAGSLSREDGE